MKKRRAPLTRIMSDAINMPETMFPGVADISIIQNHEISIENCKGILIYEAERICLKMPGFELCIEGEGLTLKSYFGSHITVKGSIESLKFSVSGVEKC